MDRKTIIITLIVIIAVLAGVAVFLYMKNGHKEQDVYSKDYFDQEPIDYNQELMEHGKLQNDAGEEVEVAIDNGNGEYLELFGSFESEEEAVAAAELYEIQFVDFAQGVAVFRVNDSRTFDEISELGKKNNWPTLAVNDIYYID